MISKKTSKNQITLPKKIVSLFPESVYFDITVEEGRIVLRPVDPDALGKVQRKLECWSSPVGRPLSWDMTRPSLCSEKRL